MRWTIMADLVMLVERVLIKCARCHLEGRAASRARACRLRLSSLYLEES